MRPFETIMCIFTPWKCNEIRSWPYSNAQKFSRLIFPSCLEVKIKYWNLKYILIKILLSSLNHPIRAEERHALEMNSLKLSIGKFIFTIWNRSRGTFTFEYSLRCSSCTVGSDHDQVWGRLSTTILPRIQLEMYYLAYFWHRFPLGPTTGGINPVIFVSSSAWSINAA